MSSEFIDIVLFGAIAIFLVYRLRSILGSSDGKIVNIRTKKNPQSKFKPKIVPKNDYNEFLEGANRAYEMIVQAYQSNSIEKVKDLLTPEAMQAMEKAKAPKSPESEKGGKIPGCSVGSSATNFGRSFAPRTRLPPRSTKNQQKKKVFGAKTNFVAEDSVAPTKFFN